LEIGNLGKEKKGNAGVAFFGKKKGLKKAHPKNLFSQKTLEVFNPNGKTFSQGKVVEKNPRKGPFKPLEGFNPFPSQLSLGRKW